MLTHPRFGEIARASRWIVLLAAIVVLAVTYSSPVEHYNSDGGIGLLASQAILDHGTLKLDPYQDRPECTYSFAGDYRVREKNGSYYYFTFGTPVFSLPFVLALRAVGLDMLDQGDEFLAQNLISAIVCCLIFLVLYQVCRAYLEFLASLIIALVTVLGSSLVSTLGTALWNTNFAVLFLSLALLQLVRQERRGASYGSYLYLFLLLTAAFLSRPTAGFFVVAAALCMGIGRTARQRLWSLGVGLALILLASFVLLVAIDWAGWLYGYYSPRKLLPQEPLFLGLWRTLLTPSRGLLVFSPFLGLVLLGSLWKLPRLRSDRLFWFGVVWIGLQVVVVSTREAWWGGHSYGPRLLTEILPAFLLLTCLVWREVVRAAPILKRERAVTAYLVLGLVAIFIHTYQGLFNVHTVAWNRFPNIDVDRQYLLDWRYPQFLASAKQVEKRWIQHRVARMEGYSMGEPIFHESDKALFVDWYAPEDAWRWSHGDRSAVVLKLGAVEPDVLYLIEVEATALREQKIDVEVNGARLGGLELGTSWERRRVVGLAGRLLEPHGPNRIELQVPYPSSPANDARLLGMSLRWLRVYPLPREFSGVSFHEDEYFRKGFDRAELGWRWSNGPTAVLAYPMEAVAADHPYALVLTSGALGSQHVTVHVNGVSIGELHFDGFAAETRELPLTGRLLRPFGLNEIELHIPGSTAPTPEDVRRLGLRVVSLRIEPR